MEVIVNLPNIITVKRPTTIVSVVIMNITQDRPVLNIHNPITNERISVDLDKHSRMSSDTKDKQISHLSKF